MSALGRAFLLLTLLAVGGCAPAAAAAISTGGSTVVDIGSGLRGPAGLSASIYATGLAHVSTFAFDDQGRLWVATAGESDTGTDAIYLVRSAGDTPQRIITGLHTPLGLLWLHGELYVSSSGGVRAYAGFDGTRFASEREVVSLAADVGEVNGLALAPDGTLLLGISAPCDHCAPTLAASASILAFDPDGSNVYVYASGIRAPVGLAFVPGTDDLLATMDQRDDLGDQTPGDWLSIVREGSDWRFPDCYGQGGSDCAGVPNPLAVLDLHAAVSGVAVVNGQLGAAIGEAALVAEWATGTVVQVTLQRSGVGYEAAVQPLLTGIANPVAVAVSPSGALLVGDWSSGVIYRIAAA
jgi:glucose/arabinose dehydrogenase